jgi:hypothetical protein
VRSDEKVNGTQKVNGYTTQSSREDRAEQHTERHTAETTHTQQRHKETHIEAIRMRSSYLLVSLNPAW